MKNMQGFTARSVKLLEGPSLQENDMASTQGRLRERGLVAFALTFFLFIIVKNAWLSDDAYITFRVVDNFIHGYGLVWNVDERVQVYTHPLWMFLLSAVYFCTHHIYYPSLILSLLVSFSAVVLFARMANSGGTAALLILLLAASKSFVDFSTSGLENPLTYLLIVLFMYVFYFGQRREQYVYWLATIAALATLNRMDTLLLFLPALLFVFYKRPGWDTVKSLILGFVPFLCWELFSLCYYGFLFPNTAYAKLNTGIAGAQLIQQGIGYLISSCSFDPLIFFAIAACIMLTFLLKTWNNLPFLIGIGLYLLYTIKVGGDFMAGRFLAEPFLMAVVLLARTDFVLPNRLLAFGLIALLGLLVPNSCWYPILKDSTVVDARGVADERAFYVDATGLLNVQRGIQWPASPWVEQGLQARTSEQRVAVTYNAGFFGFVAGPQVHVVDALALCDPLLARLPALPGWRIGHFRRELPAGYVETLESGKDVMQDRALAFYYRQLHKVIAGPLFGPERLVEVWKLNTGAYNGLLTPAP